AIPRCTIFCLIAISRRSLRKRSAIGASRSQQQLNTVWPSLHFPPRLLTSTVTARRGFLLICYRRNVTFLVRTLTNASISRACFIRNGSNPIASRLKKRPERKSRLSITPESDHWLPPCGGYRLMKVMRISTQELRVRERHDT